MKSAGSSCSIIGLDLRADSGTSVTDVILSVESGGKHEIVDTAWEG